MQIQAKFSIYHGTLYLCHNGLNGISYTVYRELMEVFLSTEVTKLLDTSTGGG